MTLAPIRLSEAADSLAKASTPEPFSASRTSNWVARRGGLPDYVQHIAHDLMEKRGKSESEAIQMAIGIVKRWARGGGKVDAGTRAAAAKAVAEWERMKAGSKIKESAGVPSWSDEQVVERAALERICVYEQQFGLDGLIGLLAGGPLAEASSWSPTLKRVAKAPQELERHEVYDGGQMVGTVSARRPYEPGRPTRWKALGLHGRELTDYNCTSKPDALKAIQTHLEEAPARVVAMPTLGKYFVAEPSSYGDTNYKAFPSELAARQAAGLPAAPTVPENNSKVEAVSESLRFDLMSVSGLEVAPLAGVQEARRRDPFDLLEGFVSGELRNFRGEWQRGGHVARLAPHSSTPGALQRRGGAPRPPGLPADQRYEGGVVRASAQARLALQRKPQVALKDLPKHIGKGSWSPAATRAIQKLRSQPEINDQAALEKAIAEGRASDTEHQHRVRNKDGSLGDYTPERQALHEAIATALLRGKQEHLNPEAIFTAGGPASGKSSLEKVGVLKLPSDVVHANPDVIREMLPEYKALKDAGRKDASGLTHEEASHLAKVVTRMAIQRRHHLLVDTVGDSGPGKFVGKIKQAQRGGYKTSVHYATTSVEEAQARADARGKKSGRYVSPDYLRSAHQAVSERFGEISKLPGVHVRVFDTSGTPGSREPKAKLLYEKLARGDKVHIADRVGFKRFMDKAKG